MRRGWLICARGIVWREALRFVQQRERFFAALVRPLLWLVIFGAGLSALVGVSVTAPYPNAVPYETYVLPGLCAMIQLFNGMQSSLSMVYDRETGAMRTLLISPYPRWFLLVCKLISSTLVSLFQVYTFLVIARLWGIDPPLWGYVAALPALVLSGLLLGAIGLFLSSAIRQLENFAGVMNFVIFPVFFASSALYPLSRLAEGSAWLHGVALFNPFTHCVELIRFALYLEINGTSLIVVAGTGVAFLGAAIWAYDPARGLLSRRR